MEGKAIEVSKIPARTYKGKPTKYTPVFEAIKKGLGYEIPCPNKEKWNTTQANIRLGAKVRGLNITCRYHSDTKKGYVLPKGNQ